MSTYELRPIGSISVGRGDAAPKQGVEGSPEAWIVVDADLSEGLHDVQPGTDDGTPVLDLKPVLGLDR